MRRRRSNGPREDEGAVETKRVGHALIVRVSGDLTLSTFDEFERAVRQAIDGRRVDVVLDLGAVRFIDSTGLRSLIRLANQSRGAGRKLRVRTASAPVRQAIEWGGLQ